MSRQALAVSEGQRLRAYWPAVGAALPRLPDAARDSLCASFTRGDRIPARLPGWKFADGGVRRALRLATAFDVVVRCLKKFSEMDEADELRILADGTVAAKRSLSADRVTEWLVRGADVPKAAAPAVWKAIRATLRSGPATVPGLIAFAGEGRSFIVRFDRS